MKSFFDKNIDKKLVVEAIDSDCKLDSEHRQQAKSLVWVLGQVYAERDFKECKILFTEEKFTTPDIAGTIDLILEIKNPIYLPKDSVGKKLIVDWKTTNSNTFDKAFRSRYIDSWQWKIYSIYGHADLFEYRCIGKSSGDTVEILLEPSETIKAYAEEYIKQCNELKNACTVFNYAPWIRHMPHACNAYGRPCPYLEICQDGIYIEGVDIKEPLHYTSIETFLLCPERYRLREITKSKHGISSEESNETAIGSAVHRGMEEIYRQLKELQ